MMGDLKDAGQGGEGEAKENQENAESVEIETDQGREILNEQSQAFREKVAALLANPMYSLPKPVRRNVRALKNLQLQHVNLEVDFFKELHELEMKYERKFIPLYEKRAQIVSGAYTPTDEECEFQSDSERDIELSTDVQKIKVDDESGDKPDNTEADIKGIPEFWLTALKNAPALADIIEEYDEPILKHLIDVTSETFNDPMRFTLSFHFEPNEYFSNAVLTKYYEMKCTPDESDVFAFEGPEIVKCKGCTIEWKKNKNVTVKTIKKKQKHKARGAVRTVTKTVANDSFFNFFSPPAIPEQGEEDELDEDTQNVLSSDFEVGNLIKDRIIPHAVLFFTGENIVDDDFEDEEEDEDEEDYDEEEDEDEEEEEDENQCLNRKKSRGQSGNNQQQAPPECKQQ